MPLASLFPRTWLTQSEPPGAKETATHMGEALKIEFIQLLGRAGAGNGLSRPLCLFSNQCSLVSPPTRAPYKDNSLPTKPPI